MVTYKKRQHRLKLAHDQVCQALRLSTSQLDFNLRTNSQSIFDNSGKALRY